LRESCFFFLENLTLMLLFSSLSPVELDGYD
jgi:hypothetical protein